MCTVLSPPLLLGIFFGVYLWVGDIDSAEDSSASSRPSATNKLATVDIFFVVFKVGLCGATCICAFVILGKIDMVAPLLQGIKRDDAYPENQ